ncbi:hypothetical protein PR048_019642 [Dryococelus australis]|uniref:Uncharacterized protein n=1 Tax=Dryococelus australis TaxID=614101 RepID=A0ABQ9H4B7_9NEOP|nr:hypothetical protein PR048_019642 [Dryococelus australis]
MGPQDWIPFCDHVQTLEKDNNDKDVRFDIEIDKPIIEYAAIVWDPYVEDKVWVLEKVLRRSVKAILNGGVRVVLRTGQAKSGEVGQDVESGEWNGKMGEVKWIFSQGAVQRERYKQWKVLEVIEADGRGKVAHAGKNCEGVEHVAGVLMVKAITGRANRDLHTWQNCQILLLGLLSLATQAIRTGHMSPVKTVSRVHSFPPQFSPGPTSLQCSRVLRAPSLTVAFTRRISRPLIHSHHKLLVRCLLASSVPFANISHCTTCRLGTKLGQLASTKRLPTVQLWLVFIGSDEAVSGSALGKGRIKVGHTHRAGLRITRARGQCELQLHNSLPKDGTHPLKLEMSDRFTGDSMGPSWVAQTALVLNDPIYYLVVGILCRLSAQANMADTSFLVARIAGDRRWCESECYLAGVRMSHQLYDKRREDVPCKSSVGKCLTMNIRKPFLRAGNTCEDGLDLLWHNWWVHLQYGVQEALGSNLGESMSNWRQASSGMVSHSSLALLFPSPKRESPHEGGVSMTNVSEGRRVCQAPSFPQTLTLEAPRCRPSFLGQRIRHHHCRSWMSRALPDRLTILVVWEGVAPLIAGPRLYPRSGDPDVGTEERRWNGCHDEKQGWSCIQLLLSVLQCWFACIECSLTSRVPAPIR